MSITDLTAVELAALMKQKKLSPVEVVSAFIERVEKENPKWNAFVTMNDRALDEARKAEEILMNNKEVGALHGLPVAIKDLTPTKGIRTTFGSPIFKDYVPNYEPLFLKRIKAAGGIVLGKTNTPEFGHKGITDNPLFGVTRNPWNEQLTPGGSSGGAAAAVAAKLVPLAEGSDGGGSIRIPASFTGVFGFKPTFGVVPYEGERRNLFAGEHPYLHNGPISRTVEDAALLFDIMKGHAPNNPSSIQGLSEGKTDLSKELKGLKIAYTRNFGLYEVSEEVAHVIDQSVQRFTELGCMVEEIEIDFGLSLNDLVRTFSGMWCVRFAASYGEIYDKYPSSFSNGMAKMIEIGRKLSAVDYKALEIKRTMVWKEMQRVFSDYDLLLSPVTAVPAFNHQMEGPTMINGKEVNPATGWMLTQIFNLTGHPAASLPVGLTKTGLPVGLQVAGNRLKDELVLQACHVYEKNFPTYQEPAQAIGRVSSIE